MAKGPRRKKNSLKAEGLGLEGTSAQSDVSQQLAPGANLGEPNNPPGGLADLQREMRSLKRAERDAFEQAREEEIANPTITHPRAAKTKAYNVRIWKPKGRQPIQESPEPEEAEEPVAEAAPKEEIVKDRRLSKGKGRQPTADVLSKTSGVTSRPTAQTSRAPGSSGAQSEQVNFPEISDGDLDYEPIEPPQHMDDAEKISPHTESDLDQHQHRERLDAGDRSPSIDDSGGSEYESNGRGSDADEYESGAEVESEEDFDVQGGYAPSSRKAVKVATQLKQGSVTVVRKGHNNRRVLSDSETGGSEYAPDFLDPDYESPSDHDPGDGDNESKDEQQVAKEDLTKYTHLDGSFDHEWKRPKLPAIRHYTQQPNKNVTPSQEYRRSVSSPQPQPAKPSKKHNATVAQRHGPDAASKTVTAEGVMSNTKRQGSFQETDNESRGSTSKDQSISRPLSNTFSSNDLALQLATPAAHRRSATGANSVRPARSKQRAAPAPTSTAQSRGHGATPGPSQTAEHGEAIQHPAPRDGAHSGSDDGSDGPADVDALILRPAGDESVWPEDTDVTFKEGNKVAGLNSQNSLKVRTLLKSTIAQELPQALALVNAFPNIAERPKLFLDIFIASTRRLGSNYTAIAQRLLQDSGYVIGLLYLPAKRMSSIRGPWYGACRDAVWEGYGLKAIEHDPKALQKSVEVLLLNYQFICPGKLVDGKYTEFKRDLPFCAEPLINLANVLFLGPKAACPIDDSAFTSSIKTGPESQKREIPQAMAALLATFAGAAIGEGLHGTREPLQDRDNEGFNSNKQETPYRDHLATLSTLHPMGRHKILGFIFKEAKTAHLKRGAAQTRTTTASTFVDPMTAGMDIDL